MQKLSRNQLQVSLAEALAVACMAGIAAASTLPHMHLLLFPELAALSHDVFRRPRGKWASQPVRLVLTPSLTAILGLFVTRHLHYGALATLLIVIGSVLTIRLLRSAIAPAISAGVLPLVLGETSWLYPVEICTGLVFLVLILRIWQSCGPPGLYADQHSTLVEVLEAPPRNRFWALILLGFVLLLAIPAEITGLRFLLFPPLVVMAYEIFGHPEAPGWMKQPSLFPVVCCLTACTGLCASRAFAAPAAGVAMTMLVSIALLRLFRLHMPPALAVGILPFAIDRPTLWYPISVLMGTIALTLCSLAYDRLYSRRRAFACNPRAETAQP